jgi:hypothetical protein
MADAASHREAIRLTGENLSGGALIADGRVVHLAAFRIDPDGAGGRHRGECGFVGGDGDMGRNPFIRADMMGASGTGYA